MLKAKSGTKERWIATGYELFAEEGPKDIRVERLARILGLNKSSFYHFFGDLDYFFQQMVVYHHTQVELYIVDVKNCRDFDPDFLNALISHKVPVLAHMQLVMNRHLPQFFDAYKQVNVKTDQAILPQWSAFIGIPDQPELALQYFQQVRDMFYSRISPNTLNYEFLHALVHEAREIVLKMSNGRAAN
jgi:AcrR family transcriptional regulator